MYSNASFSKTACYFLQILNLIIEENIFFETNLVSRLAAAVCASGNHINFDIAKQSDTVNSQNNHKIWLWCKIYYTKTARYFCFILPQLLHGNVPFQMNIVSHLAAADCASGVVGNMEISKHTWTIIYHQQDPDNMNSIASFSTTARYF